MTPRFHALAAAACLAFCGAAFAQQSTTTQPAPMQAQQQERDTRAYRELRDATEHLHDSIAALRTAGSDQDRQGAITMAQNALARTRQAMSRLPDNLRATDAAQVDHATYDKSVQELMAAADRLRGAVQQIAQGSPTSQRNQAIQQADKALMDTQAAMASAYGASLTTGRTNRMGAARDSTSVNSASTSTTSTAPSASK